VFREEWLEEFDAPVKRRVVKVVRADDGLVELWELSGKGNRKLVSLLITNEEWIKRREKEGRFEFFKGNRFNARESLSRRFELAPVKVSVDDRGFTFFWKNGSVSPWYWTPERHWERPLTEAWGIKY